MLVLSRSLSKQQNVFTIKNRAFCTHEITGDKKPGFSFEVVYKSRKSNARVGVIRTPHGDIHTPSFVPVATNASLKHVDHRVLLDSGLQLIFCNTFHLLVHPGKDVVKSAGGLHKFMNYPRPIITDSGGFQVFSLLDPKKNKENDELKGKNRKEYPGLIIKIREEGVTFRSYRNGDTIFLSPESSVEAQKAFGADIIIPLDELIAYNVSPKHLLRSFDRTHRWEKRSLDHHLANRNGQAMYSVLHGGPDKALRKQSIEILSAMDFDGHAIGGSIGKDKREMVELLTYMMPMLSPQLKPIHLLGIGDVASIDLSIPLGIDTFDSAYPSRTARHGLLTTSRGNINIDAAEFKNKHEPIDPECECHTCKHFTASYLYHLYKTNEVAGLSYGTLHNLHFLTKKFEKIREKILRDEI